MDFLSEIINGNNIRNNKALTHMIQGHGLESLFPHVASLKVHRSEGKLACKVEQILPDFESGIIRGAFYGGIVKS